MVTGTAEFCSSQNLRAVAESWPPETAAVAARNHITPLYACLGKTGQAEQHQAGVRHAGKPA
jgi:hypothetical protein